MPMSYTTPKPRWWPSDLRGTDANSGDGWVGSCVAALPSGAGPKVGQDTRHSNRVFEHRCWPRRIVRVAASRPYTDGNSVGTRAAMLMGHLADSLTQTKRSERLAESNRASLPTKLIDAPTATAPTRPTRPTALGPYNEPYGFGLGIHR